MKKNTLRDGGRTIPQICQFWYTTALFRPAIVDSKSKSAIFSDRIANIGQNFAISSHCISQISRDWIWQNISPLWNRKCWQWWRMAAGKISHKAATWCEIVHSGESQPKPGGFPLTTPEDLLCRFSWISWIKDCHFPLTEYTLCQSP